MKGGWRIQSGGRLKEVREIAREGKRAGRRQSQRVLCENLREQGVKRRGRKRQRREKKKLFGKKRAQKDIAGGGGRGKREGGRE